MHFTDHNKIHFAEMINIDVKAVKNPYVLLMILILQTMISWQNAQLCE